VVAGTRKLLNSCGTVWIWVMSTCSSLGPVPAPPGFGPMGLRLNRVKSCVKTSFAPMLLRPTPGATGIVVQLGSAWFWNTAGSVLGWSFTARTLNERLWKPGVNPTLGAGRLPVKAIRIVPAGPDTWPSPVPTGRKAVAKSTNTGASRTIPARQDDSCFTREAYNRDFGSRLG